MVDFCRPGHIYHKGLVIYRGLLYKNILAEKSQLIGYFAQPISKDKIYWWIKLCYEPPNLPVFNLFIQFYNYVLLWVYLFAQFMGLKLLESEVQKLMKMCRTESDPAGDLHYQ